MPRNPGGTYRAHPGVSRSAFIAPADTLADELIKAGRTPRTVERFTAEHRAAYIAFAGVSDERVARDYWRAGIDWDDVKTWRNVGVVNPADVLALAKVLPSPAAYTHWREVRLGTGEVKWIERFVAADLTPAQVSLWIAAMPGGRKHLDMITGLSGVTDPRTVAAWATAGVKIKAIRSVLSCSLEQVRPYLAHLTDDEQQTHIATLIERGITAATVGDYWAAGMPKKPLVLMQLHKVGLTPRTVAGVLRGVTSHDVSKSLTQAQTTVKACRALTSSTALIAAVMAEGGGVEHVTEWMKTNNASPSPISHDDLAFVVAAGITPDEVRAHPEVLGRPRAVFEALAGLRDATPSGVLALAA